MKKAQVYLIMQGFTAKQLAECKNLERLARWTPFACAVFGTIGILLQSPDYFLLLGLGTALGAFTRTSFYDLIFNYSLRYIFQCEKIPQHGNARRLGCGIGATMYLLSGFGFYFHVALLAYIPSLLMIILASFAAITHYCFASAIYAALTSTQKKENTCCA